MPSDRYEIVINIRGNDNTSSSLTKVNRELNDLNTKATGASAGTKKVSGGLNSMKTAAIGFVAAYGAIEIGRLALDFAKFGNQVDSANTVFTSLTGGTEEAAIALQLLRDKTGGVVDDLALMRGANQLLTTGLASTAEQAADLVSLGAKLGAALGVDAAAAVDNLNSALLNNSFVRLDTLGISAQAVRDRVNELKEAGLDVSAAFAQATFEEGQKTLERLGDAANVSETAFARLETRARNAGQALAEDFFEVVEQGAIELEKGIIALEQTVTTLGTTLSQAGGIVEFGLTGGIGGVDPLFDLQKELGDAVLQNSAVRGNGELEVKIEPLIDFAINAPDLFNRLASGNLTDAVLNGGNNLISPDDIKALEEALGHGISGGLFNTGRQAELTVEALQAVRGEINELILSQVSSSLFGDTTFQDIQNSQLGQFVGIFSEAGRERVAIAEREAEARAELARELETVELASLQAQYDDAVAFSKDQIALDEQEAARRAELLEEEQAFRDKQHQQELQNLGNFYAEDRAFREEQAQLDEQEARRREELLKEEEAFRNLKREPLQDIDNAFASIELLSDRGTFGIGDDSFFDPAKLDELQRRAERLREEAEALREQASNDEFRFISEDDVKNAESLADEAADIANEAERGAEAFAGLSLSGLLGETSGGRLGELLDLVTEDLAAGLDPEDEAGRAAIDDLESDFNLATGRETELSQFVDDTLSDQIAGLAQRFGADIAAQAAEGALGVIEQGQIAGLGDQQIAAQASLAVVGASAGAQFQNFQDSQSRTICHRCFGLVWAT